MNTPKVDTPEEYFQQAGERQALLQTLDHLITSHAPRLERSMFGGMTGQWVAYGMQPYKSKSMKEPSQWPVIALANQKNYASLYIMATEDGNYLAELFAPRLGKVSVGKSCIRIKKQDDIDQEALVELFKKVNQLYAADKALL